MKLLFYRLDRFACRIVTVANAKGVEQELGHAALEMFLRFFSDGVIESLSGLIAADVYLDCEFHDGLPLFSGSMPWSDQIGQEGIAL